MDKICFGVDIGGTKTAVLAGRSCGEDIEIIERLKFDTVAGSAEPNLRQIEALLRQLQSRFGKPAAIGVSCGGPLDAEQGLILSPPNLPDWDNVPIVSLLQSKFHVPVAIENDADACSLAEHRYGAGRGSRNMIFLTFGTGLGAGLILNGRLYRGATGSAGEVGHIRLRPSGPVGYYKSGSFEGFCSGGGLRQLGKQYIEQRIASGDATAWALAQAQNDALSAKDIAEAARAGDVIALQIMERCGTAFGEGLSILIDILNPERIVAGSIFTRCGDLLTGAMQRVIDREALACSAKACQIVPAALGEQIGDFAALSVASRCLQSAGA